MNWKKFGKISLTTLGIFLLAASGVIGYFYYQYYGKYNENEEKYPHHIGYLSPKNEDFKKGFTRCNPEKLPIGFYHSSAEFAFKKNKKVFRDLILANFDSKSYNDTGFLNIRFLINCKGEVGNVEINELDTDFEPTDLSDQLVQQILDLSLKKENWQPFAKKEGRDLYMYLIFKLENGKISEILP